MNEREMFNGGRMILYFMDMDCDYTILGLDKIYKKDIPKAVQTA